MANKYWQILHYYTNYKYSPASNPHQYGFIVSVKKLVCSLRSELGHNSICDNSSVVGGVMVDVIAGLVPTPVLLLSVPPTSSTSSSSSHLLCLTNPLQRLEASDQDWNLYSGSGQIFGLDQRFFGLSGRLGMMGEVKWGGEDCYIKHNSVWTTRQMAGQDLSNSLNQQTLLKPARTVRTVGVWSFCVCSHCAVSDAAMLGHKLCRAGVGVVIK